MLYAISDVAQLRIGQRFRPDILSYRSSNILLPALVVYCLVRQQLTAHISRNAIPLSSKDFDISRLALQVKVRVNHALSIHTTENDT